MVTVRMLMLALNSGHFCAQVWPHMDLYFIFLVQENHRAVSSVTSVVELSPWFSFLITNQVFVCMLLCSKAENLCISAHSSGHTPYRQEKGER